MKKTREQKALLRLYKMRPVFWEVIYERKDRLLVVNRLTGETRVLDK